MNAKVTAKEPIISGFATAYIFSCRSVKNRIPPFDFVRVNERRVSDFGLSQGSRFNGTNCANRNYRYGPTNEHAHA
jgi:hypothetical protein